MNKRTILSAILILSISISIFCLTKYLKLIYEFKDNIVEFATPSKLQVELEKGRYDLFVLYSKSDIEEDLDYIISKDDLSPNIIKIKEGSSTSTSMEEGRISYTLFDKVYKGIGSFEIDRKKSISIESNVKNVHSEKLAFAKEGALVDIFGIMKYGLFLLLSIGIMIISGISLLLLKRNKNIITNMA